MLRITNPFNTKNNYPFKATNNYPFNAKHNILGTAHMWFWLWIYLNNDVSVFNNELRTEKYRKLTQVVRFPAIF